MRPLAFGFCRESREKGWVDEHNSHYSAHLQASKRKHLRADIRLMPSEPEMLEAAKSMCAGAATIASVGAAVGIGNVFSSLIHSVAPACCFSLGSKSSRRNTVP
ncbi:hypothetical protein CFOL_v3_13442 [Cephalotus follicularis]|uniref:Uncharacterized protein n=1 Tax=Cephalotus follicularis TaxID=3775 RepID=A0A1Q3BQ15_CEPFO|nr:hypothetical protein CFOL_v3_13442 [Cephalotus follicularis]